MLFKLEITSLRTALTHGLGEHKSLEARLASLEKMDKDCLDALQRNAVIQNRRKEPHNWKHKIMEFQLRDLAMLTNSFLMKHY